MVSPSSLGSVGAAVAMLVLLAAALCAWLLARRIMRQRSTLRQAEAAADCPQQTVRELGSYHLLRKLGSGGMGEVWLARHRLLARPAAIKLIQAQHLAQRPADDAELAVARFEHEARTTASLRSRHTVEIYDFGIAEDGTFFLVMELLEGIDAYALAARHGLPPLGRVIAILRQACRSLAEAHDHGLVHRDIKPSNLFVSRRADEFDLVKVLDFGMAVDPHTEAGERLSVAGFVSGTPCYMAPEQARGMLVDQRSDLYALGCVGYFLLTGQMVFDQSSPMEQMLAHVHAEPAPPSLRTQRILPGSLENLILSCLSKDPAGRPQSAREFDAALAAVVVPHDERWDEERCLAWWACTRCFDLDEEAFAQTRPESQSAHPLPQPSRNADTPPSADIRLFPQRRRKAG